jgi:hypothetical protein
MGMWQGLKISRMGPKMLNDQRKVRFAAIDGLTRDDLPLANEIWLQDLYRAPWANREMMKLAVLFVRYMANAQSTSLSMAEIEVTCQFSSDDVRKTLAAMKGFGAIDSFVVDRTQAQVALNLSLLQRLQVLEARQRFVAVLPDAQRIWLTPGEKWVLPKAA